LILSYAIAVKQYMTSTSKERVGQEAMASAWVLQRVSPSGATPKIATEGSGAISLFHIYKKVSNIEDQNGTSAGHDQYV
jgi:hypothetical protein